MKYYELINQFKEAGYRHFDLTNRGCMLIFYRWLKERNELKKDMLELLDFLGVDYNNSKTCELNKTKYDTCTENLNTRVITDIDSFSEASDVIDAKFEVENGNPILVVSGKKGPIKPVIPTEVIDTYMAHNPYNIEDFDKLAELHNNGTNIIASVYGKNKEKDKKYKVSKITNLMYSLDYDYVYKYTENDDSYLCVVASKAKVRK